MIRSDQATADEDQRVAWGACVVSDQASAAGVTAVPTPITDDGSDLWFAHLYMFSGFEFISGVGALLRGTQYSLDSKAMRKVDVGQDLLTVVEMDASSSGTVIIQASRMLLKLH